MRVMVIIKANKHSEAGEMPKEAALAAMGTFDDELIRAGILLAGDGLHPTSKAARVRFSGERRTVINGPFGETRELIAGFWIWRVQSLQEAIDWVKRIPTEAFPEDEDAEVEIRPLFEAEDFGAEFTPELREQEERQRAMISNNG
jgi:hypothetical protein